MDIQSAISSSKFIDFVVQIVFVIKKTFQIFHATLEVINKFY